MKKACEDVTPHDPEPIPEAGPCPCCRRRNARRYELKGAKSQERELHRVDCEVCGSFVVPIGDPTWFCKVSMLLLISKGLPLNTDLRFFD